MKKETKKIKNVMKRIKAGAGLLKFLFLVTGFLFLSTQMANAAEKDSDPFSKCSPTGDSCNCVAKTALDVCSNKIQNLKDSEDFRSILLQYKINTDGGGQAEKASGGKDHADQSMEEAIEGYGECDRMKRRCNDACNASVDKEGKEICKRIGDVAADLKNKIASLNDASNKFQDTKTAASDSTPSSSPSSSSPMSGIGNAVSSMLPLALMGGMAYMMLNPPGGGGGDGNGPVPEPINPDDVLPGSDFSLDCSTQGSAGKKDCEDTLVNVCPSANLNADSSSRSEQDQVCSDFIASYCGTDGEGIGSSFCEQSPDQAFCSQADKSHCPVCQAREQDCSGDYLACLQVENPAVLLSDFCPATCSDDSACVQAKLDVDTIQDPSTQDVHASATPSNPHDSSSANNFIDSVGSITDNDTPVDLGDGGAVTNPGVGSGGSSGTLGGGLTGSGSNNSLASAEGASDGAQRKPGSNGFNNYGGGGGSAGSKASGSSYSRHTASLSSFFNSVKAGQTAKSNGLGTGLSGSGGGYGPLFPDSNVGIMDFHSNTYQSECSQSLLVCP